jgi:UDP-glucose 4-epimerase
VINIGCDQEISIRDLAFVIKRITGSNSEVVMIPYADAYGPGFEDMFRRVPSVDKLVSLVGYRPQTPLDHIIELTAEDLRRDLRSSESPGTMRAGAYA